VTRDLNRSAVYSAEDQVARLLDRGGGIDFFGSRLTLPPERRFADIGSVRRYVTAVLDMVGCEVPVQVRERRGSGRAHYDAATATIAIPLTGIGPQRWAAREVVVLHEVAHHLTAIEFDDVAAHGPEFCATLLRLVGTVIAPEAALVLRAALDSAGVPVAAGVRA
jgi:putative metallohydrolase (TIGR04338 family)